MESHFGPLDYVVFALVLAVSSAIGLYYRFTGGKQKTFKVSSLNAFLLLVFKFWHCSISSDKLTYQNLPSNSLLHLY